MSDANERTVWEPKVPTLPEGGFQSWLNWETKFGEYGDPGYERMTFPITSVSAFGNNDPFDLIWTLYRGEDGLLLAVHASYYDAEGLRHPFIFIVHPDHRGKGIASKIARDLEDEFIANEAHRYGMSPAEFAALSRAELAALVVPDMYKNVEANQSGAGFLNKLVDQFYNVEKEF
jgi:GNAT superfamily N-acetyltransferase